MSVVVRICKVMPEIKSQKLHNFNTFKTCQNLVKFR